MRHYRHRSGRNSAALIAAALLSLGLVACSEAEAPDCGGLKVNDPWVRAAPVGAAVMAAYFSLANEGDSRVVVNGASSSQFDRAELHQTVVNDEGQASMQPLKKVTVPAGEAVDFKPGGRHVMLFSPSQHYAVGDQVELILACGSQKAELPVAATVRADGPGMASSGDGMQGMDQGSMQGSDGGSQNGADANDTGAAK